jgi:hypothetical protein
VTKREEMWQDKRKGKRTRMQKDIKKCTKEKEDTRTEINEDRNR